MKCWEYVECLCLTFIILYQLMIWYLIYITFSILTNVWILDGTIIKNDDSCEKGEEKLCVCDKENLFYGWDPLACQRIKDEGLISRIKRPGNELTDSGNNLHVFRAVDEVILTSCTQFSCTSKLRFGPSKFWKLIVFIKWKYCIYYMSE